MKDPLALSKGYSCKDVAETTEQGPDSLLSVHFRYPRYRLLEVNTHAAMAKNARSTRAVPTDIFLREVENDPASPLYMGENCPGMSSHTKHKDSDALIHARLELRWPALALAREMLAKNVHKQDVNNLLDLWLWTDQVCTGDRTGWLNFVNQRDNTGASPELQVIANAVRGVVLPEVQSTYLPPVGRWHLPFITRREKSSYSVGQLAMISAGRCASVSYVPPGSKEPDPIKDAERAVKMLTSDPIHESPFEHIAIYLGDPSVKYGKYYGWCSLRTLMESRAPALGVEYTVGTTSELYVRDFTRSHRLPPRRAPLSDLLEMYMAAPKHLRP